jgi:transcriptional regulator of acetoin/glycerol metabolism
MLPNAGSVRSHAGLCDARASDTLKALELLHGNMTRAAKLLGIDRTTLYRRVKRYEAAGVN